MPGILSKEMVAYYEGELTKRGFQKLARHSDKPDIRNVLLGAQALREGDDFRKRELVYPHYTFIEEMPGSDEDCKATLAYVRRGDSPWICKGSHVNLSFEPFCFSFEPLLPETLN